MSTLRALSVVSLLTSMAVGTTAAAESGEPPPEAVLADIPFADANPLRIYVDLAPDGQSPFVMLLDTGASSSIMSPAAARRRGVNIRRGKSSSYRKKTRLGRDVQFWVDTSRSDTGTTSGFEFALLGQTFLRDYVLEIDFDGRRVRFLDPELYEVPETTDATDTAVLPLAFQDTRPKIEISLGGFVFDAMIDTGAPSTLLLGGRVAKRAGIDLESLPPLAEISLTVGSTSTLFYEAPDLRIADFQLGPIPVWVAPRGIFNQATPSQAVVGLDLLQQFRVRFDFPRRRLWLRRERPEPMHLARPYAPMREVGVVLDGARSESTVLAVLPGSTAEKIGLQRGDRISGILTESVPGLIAREESFAVFREREDGTEIEVRLPPGSKPPPPGPDMTEAEQRALWEKKRDQRIYVRDKGGWVVVEGYRKRQGQKEGEVWVSYEEMRRLQSEERE